MCSKHSTLYKTSTHPKHAVARYVDTQGISSDLPYFSSKVTFGPDGVQQVRGPRAGARARRPRAPGLRGLGSARVAVRTR